MRAEFLDGARINDAGQLVLPLDDLNGRKIFFKEFFLKSAVGQQLMERDSSDTVDLDVLEDKINAVIEKWFGAGYQPTIAEVEQIVSTLIAVRDPILVRAESAAPVPVVDDRPRNADGTFKSTFQIFSEEHSAFECAEYAKTNPQYAEWRRREFSRQGLQVGFKVLGSAERSTTEADYQLLGDFAEAYKAAPAARTRPYGGRITLDATHVYSPQQFEELISEASKVGLL